jgi:mono/diheme cytochrome c family protein
MNHRENSDQWTVNSGQSTVVSDQRAAIRERANRRPCDLRSPRKWLLKIIAGFGFAALLLGTGCRQDMHNEPKMIPQRGSEFFADHRGARPQVEGTVARGQLDAQSYFNTGLIQGANGYREEQDLMPFPVTMTVLERGQERFNVYCAPCHSRVGNGLGMIVERGFKPAANFHDQVRLSQPISHYFYVMTHGYGAMPDYSVQLSPADRWAVAAYIRALQLSQAASMQNVPAGVKVESLNEIAKQQHLPESYAGPWALPASTAVQAYPHVTSEGTPGMAPANPADPQISIPLAKPAPAK